MNSQFVDHHAEKIRGAIEARGGYLLHIYRQLAEAGIDNRKEILCQAIRAWGKTKAAVPSFEEASRYIEKVENGNSPVVYARSVLHSDADLGIMEMRFCPLLSAWKKAGATPREQTDLCDIACEGDYGSAGDKLELIFDCRLADGAECCRFRIQPKR